MAIKPILSREVTVLELSYIDKVIGNTIKAAEQWDIFAAQCEDIEVFKKAFHLRPTSKKVTVVSTLETKPMRGVEINKTEVAQFLKELHDEELHKEGFDEITTINKTTSLTNKGFKECSKSKDKPHEEHYQAKMISFMETNQALKSFLKIDNLVFIASEFILSEGGKIDIVGYDGRNIVFFFELKTPGNKIAKPVKESTEYMETYAKLKKDETINVLLNYPINSIKTKDVEFHGYAVYGYSEELDKENSKPFKEEPGVIRFIC